MRASSFICGATAILTLGIALPSRAENAPTVGATRLSYGSFFRTTGDIWALEAAWAWTPAPRFEQLELGGGLRASTGRSGVSIPLEAFVRARLVGKLGRCAWQPAIGPELGVSGLAAFSPRADQLPSDLDAVESGRLSPLYLSFDAAPLRFRFGSFTVSALELSLGTTLAPTGTAFRTELGVLHVGYVL